jgi:hypothetical protein
MPYKFSEIIPKFSGFGEPGKSAGRKKFSTYNTYQENCIISGEKEEKISDMCDHITYFEALELKMFALG